MRNPIKNITAWARENHLHPFLLVDLRSSKINAIIIDYVEASEYASKKNMAVYTEDMFNIGFWLGEDPAYNKAFYRFAVENDITRELVGWVNDLEVYNARVNKALEPYNANLIIIKNWNVEHHDDALNKFVAFRDTMGLTMFLLKYSQSSNEN